MIIDEIDQDVVLGFLEHYGVKGMHWGVRKDEDLAGLSSSLQRDLANNPSKPLTAEEKANVARAQKKFEKKLEKSDSDSEGHKGWRPTKKQVATIAIGAAAAAAIIGGTIATKRYLDVGSKPYSVDQYKNLVRDAETPGWIKGYAGQHMSEADFKGITHTSVDRVWGHRDYLTKDSFNQKEMKFPAGHKFFRVSHAKETGFDRTTFMLGSKEDLARYHLGWKDSTTNIIDFTSKEELRVPDLHTRLEATREALRANGAKHVTPDVVLRHYDNHAGSSFSTRVGRSILENLKKLGYGAIIDDMDAGVYGESPMLLFKPEIMNPKNFTPNKQVDVKGLKEILTDIPNRR